MVREDESVGEKKKEKMKAGVKMWGAGEGGRRGRRNEGNKRWGMKKDGRVLSCERTEEEGGTTGGKGVGIVFRWVVGMCGFVRGA
ncbi:hypothetical protein, partial [Kocuria rosea]|uniref:hypothetical protein n=1 Tax=Kocuria rosea TaxID=1275 RepID=UPI001C92F68D